MLFGVWRKRSIWRRGEDAAARYLRRRGHRVLARNLRLPMGEIDLLTLERATGTIVIVEVKARRSAPNDRVRLSPAANIDNAKQRKLRTLARAVKHQPPYRDKPIRIDALAVVFVDGRRSPAELKHYIGAVRDS